MSFAGGLFQALYITKVVCIGGCNSLKIFHICTVSREPPPKKNNLLSRLYNFALLYVSKGTWPESF
jgi:hypothetical protein